MGLKEAAFRKAELQDFIVTLDIAEQALRSQGSSIVHVRRLKDITKTLEKIYEEKYFSGQPQSRN